MEYEIQFTDVGRLKKCWTSKVSQRPTEAIILKLVSKSGAIVSRGVDCEFLEVLGAGTLYVGGFRPVGSFRVRELPQRENHGKE